MEKFEIDLFQMCNQEKVGPVIFPNEMTSHDSETLCKLFDSEIFLIEDQSSAQIAWSLMNQTKKGTVVIKLERNKMSK